ncbi:hypothetical protein AVEN_102356-1, partial [Araneus ventricosus]
MTRACIVFGCLAKARGIPALWMKVVDATEPSCHLSFRAPCPVNTRHPNKSVQGEFGREFTIVCRYHGANYKRHLFGSSFKISLFQIFIP